MDRVLTCILNDKAGSNNSGKARALVSQMASERGWEAHFLLSSSGADLPRLAEQACAKGGLVVSGGGDGTIAAVAAALVGKNAILGVLPLGTLNHFAKDLTIPLELEKAVETLFTGKVVRVDVGEVNGRIFLNNSSIGFYPRIVQERERQQRRGRGKWLAFVQALMHVFQRSRTLQVEIASGHSTHQFYDTPFVFVGNNRYAVAGLEIGTRATLDGGKLWVCTAPSTSRWKLLALAVEALLGFIRDADLTVFETDQSEVRVLRAQVQVATDGEVSVMQTPLRYSIRPRELRVLVPASE
jgi:YegS/Rv2252/BmrU family lipid kinase